jgi:hypothetical protein
MSFAPFLSETIADTFLYHPYKKLVDITVPANCGSVSIGNLDLNKHRFYHFFMCLENVVAWSAWWRVFFNGLYDVSKHRTQVFFAVVDCLSAFYARDCFIGYTHPNSTNHINLYIMKDPNSRTSWFSQCRFVSVSQTGGGLMLFAGLQKTVTNNTTEICIASTLVNGIGKGSQIIVYGAE